MLATDVDGIRLEVGSGKCSRRFDGQGRRTPLKGCGNGAGKGLSIEFEMPGARPDVVEVFHPTVGHVEFDHCLKLFAIAASTG